MTDWTCPHGAGPGMRRGDCAPCNNELARRPVPQSMTGDARADELTALLNEPNAYRVSDIHQRIEGLVGRPVWTHEMAQDLALAAEARSWAHPDDLAAHAVGSLRALMDDKPILVVETGGES